MKRSDIEQNLGHLADETADVVRLSDLLDALLYLGEQELSGSIEIIAQGSREGYVTVSSAITARLFGLIAREVPGGLLEIKTNGGMLIITVRSQNGSAPSDRTILKIAKISYLAGFTARLDGEQIHLTTEISLNRTLSVYAIAKTALLKAFKKHV